MTSVINYIYIYYILIQINSINVKKMKDLAYTLLFIMTICCICTKTFEKKEIFKLQDSLIQNNDFISKDRQLQLFNWNDTNNSVISPLNPLLIENPKGIYQVSIYNKLIFNYDLG